MRALDFRSQSVGTAGQFWGLKSRASLHFVKSTVPRSSGRGIGPSCPARKCQTCFAQPSRNIRRQQTPGTRNLGGCRGFKQPSGEPAEANGSSVGGLTTSSRITGERAVVQRRNWSPRHPPRSSSTEREDRSRFASGWILGEASRKITDPV